MYVVPTPYALANGTTGLGTLILPAEYCVKSDLLVEVGCLERVEVDEVLVSYEFNLQTNAMISYTEPNPHAGRIHAFKAYRMRGRGDNKVVALNEV